MNFFSNSNYLPFLFIVFIQVLPTLTNSQQQPKWINDYKVFELTSDNFYFYAGSDYHLFVEFYNPWCVYSREVAPEYAKLHNFFNGKQSPRRDILIARINGVQEKEISLPYNIHSFPTIAYYPPKSKEIASFFRSGFRSQHLLQEWVEKLTREEDKINVEHEFPASEGLKEQELELTGSNDSNFFKHSLMKASNTIQSISEYLQLKFGHLRDEIVFFLLTGTGILAAFFLLIKLNSFRNHKLVNYAVRPIV